MSPRLLVVLISSVSVALVVPGPALAASAAPTVTSVSASSGSLDGGARLVVHGNGFGNASKVYFGGTAAHLVRVAGAHALTVVVPRHRAGRVDIRVVGATGKSAVTRADRFTYVAPPSVATVSPASGAGTRVTVRGKNFSHVKAVLFGKTKGGKVHVISATTLLVTAPAHPPGTVDVHVQTSYGTSRSVKADHFAYPAVIVSIPITPTPTPTPTPAPAPIAPRPPPLVITTGTLPDETSGSTYPTTILAATGGTPPYTWSATGLPNGVTVAADGTVAGHSYALAGQRQVTLTVSDTGSLTASTRLPLHVLAASGQVYAWGYDAFGNIGDGSINPPGGMVNTSSPIKVAGLSDVVQVATSLTNGYALKADGGVWAWGGNAKGTIGDGTKVDSKTPVAVTGMPAIRSIAAGGGTTYALAADGTAYAWGAGTSGQLGNGDLNDRSAPVQVSGVTDGIAIVAGASTAFVVRKDGTVLAWGNGSNDGLGNAVTGIQSTPAPIPGLSDVVSMAAGIYDTFALHGDGTVSGWGLDNGAPGFGVSTAQPTPITVPFLSHISQIALGTQSGYAVRDDGTVLAWGVGEDGELGDGNRNNTTTTAVSVLGLSTAQAVWAAGSSAFALLADGTVRAWGANLEGNIGDGTATQRITPVAATWLPRTLSLADGFSYTAYQVRRPITVPVNPFPPPPPPAS